MPKFIINEGWDDQTTVEAWDWIVVADKFIVFVDGDKTKLYTTELSGVHTIKRVDER